MFVKYIGKKPKKADTVLGSKTVWNGNGDVQEVPDALGLKLTTEYPDIWVDTDEKPVVLQEDDAPTPIDLTGAMKKAEAIDTVKELRAFLKKNYEFSVAGNPGRDTVLNKFADFISDNSPVTEDKSGPIVFNGVTVEGNLQSLLALAQAGGFSNQPEEAVKQAIDMLGGVDSGFYDTQTGMPLQQAVQLLVGESAGTMENIDIVMANKSDDESL